MRKPMSRSVFVLLACMCVGAILPLVDGACAPGPSVLLKRVTQRGELIGGPRALGEVGDWLFENDKVRIIIQDEGFSRGFGVFGGKIGLLPLDKRRAIKVSDEADFRIAEALMARRGEQLSEADFWDGP